MKTKLRILYLEDSETDCELIRQVLAEEGIDSEIRRYDSRPGFVAELEKKEFDIVFADCALPSFSGMNALELCRKEVPEVPFIFVSGTMGEETAIESLKKGATDYVLKHRLSRLAPAVRRAIAEAEERAKSQEMEERLRQSQRLEAVGTLAGGVAHDFNNILTIIMGHSALLPMEAERPGRVQEISAIIDRASQRGMELIKQLLAFARKGDGSFTSTNINELVLEITAMLREAMPKNIVFEFQLEEGLPQILADPGQVERGIMNLATNARDAMPGGGTLTFATSRISGDKMPPHASEERNQDYICLCVSDTGTGMDEATVQRIFEPFFTTKAKGLGTGLGMPVVYGLMQSHNGVIDVESTVGKGTAISLFFPIPAQIVPRPEEKTAPPPQALNGTETVLIVDDEPDVIYFLEIILEQHGYHVLSARTAEDALEILHARGNEVRLLFSDLGLPKLDGFGLSEQAVKLNPGLKTILASGYVDATVKAKMTKGGVDGFVAKPYDTTTLLQTIRAILDKQK